jgi:hypothetical protein
MSVRVRPCQPYMISPKRGSEFKSVRARWVVRRQTVNMVPPGKYWGGESLGTHQLQVRSSSGQNTWLLTRPMPDRGRPDLPNKNFACASGLIGNGKRFKPSELSVRIRSRVPHKTNMGCVAQLVEHLVEAQEAQGQYLPHPPIMSVYYPAAVG